MRNCYYTRSYPTRKIKYVAIFLRVFIVIYTRLTSLSPRPSHTRASPCISFSRAHIFRPRFASPRRVSLLAKRHDAASAASTMHAHRTYRVGQERRHFESVPLGGRKNDPRAGPFSEEKTWSAGQGRLTESCFTTAKGTRSSQTKVPAAAGFVSAKLCKQLAVQSLRSLRRSRLLRVSGTA